MAETAAPVVFPTTPNPLNRNYVEKRSRNGAVFFNKATTISAYLDSPLSLSSSSSMSKVFIKFPFRRRPNKRTSSCVKPFSPVMEWQDYKVKIEIDVPVSVAYNCYSDREAIPRWMPIISSVKILEDKPDLSRWSMRYNAFGHNIEFSWLARNMQPIRNQKIHWRSVEGLPNRGAVRFFPKGDSSCVLTVSCEVPQILLPVASALQPTFFRRHTLPWFGKICRVRKNLPSRISPMISEPGHSWFNAGGPAIAEGKAPILGKTLCAVMLLLTHFLFLFSFF